MYDEAIKTIAISNLEQKTIAVSNTTVALSAQAYIVNKNKRIKQEWSSILLHAFENIDIFSKEQQNNIERLYNKVSNI